MRECRFRSPSALGERRFEGQLSTSPEGRSGGTIEFEVRAKIRIEAGVFIRAGYSANADIILERKDKVSLPGDAREFEDGKAIVEVEVAPQVRAARHQAAGRDRRGGRFGHRLARRVQGSRGRRAAAVRRRSREVAADVEDAGLPSARATSDLETVSRMLSYLGDIPQASDVAHERRHRAPPRRAPCGRDRG
jgi:hypothetical protein